MFARIENLLNSEQLALVDKLIASHSFVDGSSTAGVPTRKYKHNLQLDLRTASQREELGNMMVQVVNSNPLLRVVAFPRRITMPLISKYVPGMSYGWHIDNPLMPGIGGPVRTDLAVTVFLNDANLYDGGELLARSFAGDVKVKMQRGDAFIYPATTRHQVLEVTRGERLALVFWIQSMVADGEKRDLLYQLDAAYAQLTKENPDSEVLQMIQQVQTNLMRAWVEV